MSAVLPPGGMGKGPHTGSPVPRLELELTPDEKDALEPIIERMRTLATDNTGVAGFDCPACKQLVHLYRTPLSYKTVQLVVLLYCEFETIKQFHLRNDGQLLWGLTTLPVEIWLLPYFGLIEPYTLPETREYADGTIREIDVEQPGEYCLTEYAEDWIARGIEIPSHAVSYNGNVLYLDAEVGLRIEQGTGHEFDLPKLMATFTDKRKAMLLRGDEVRRPRRPRR